MGEVFNNFLIYSNLQGRPDIPRCHINPSKRKTNLFEEVLDEIPIQPIICLFRVTLIIYNPFSLFIYISNDFMCYDDIIHNFVHD